MLLVSSLCTIHKRVPYPFVELDALVCVAGGWVGGSTSDDDVFGQTEKM